MERIEGGAATPSPELADDAALVPGVDAKLGAELPPEKAQRFYDRLRRNIERAISRSGGDRLGPAKEILLFAPDVFILLWRLVRDERVSTKNKMLLGSGIAYYLFPLDFLPEALLGPVGYLDDLVLGVFILNKVLQDTDEAIVREHWSGQVDLLEMMRKVLKSADSLVPSRFVNRVKRWVR
jgi:uncharacterized membrane protein YkvA (DUF1232 family)